MDHVNFKYEDIRVGNNRACLNYNLLGICSYPNFYYRPTKSNPTYKMIKAVKIKLGYAIVSYVAEGGVSNKINRPVKYLLPESEHSPETPSNKCPNTIPTSVQLTSITRHLPFHLHMSWHPHTACILTWNNNAIIDSYTSPTQPIFSIPIGCYLGMKYHP